MSVAFSTVHRHSCGKFVFFFSVIGRLTNCPLNNWNSRGYVKVCVYWRAGKHVVYLVAGKLHLGKAIASGVVIYMGYNQCFRFLISIAKSVILDWPAQVANSHNIMYGRTMQENAVVQKEDSCLSCPVTAAVEMDVKSKIRVYGLIRFIV